MNAMTSPTSVIELAIWRCRHCRAKTALPPPSGLQCASPDNPGDEHVWEQWIAHHEPVKRQRMTTLPRPAAGTSSSVVGSPVGCPRRPVSFSVATNHNREETP